MGQAIMITMHLQPSPMHEAAHGLFLQQHLQDAATRSRGQRHTGDGLSTQPEARHGFVQCLRGATFLHFQS